MNVEGLVSVEGRLSALLETMQAFAEATNDTRRLLDTVTERVTRLVGEGCSPRTSSIAAEASTRRSRFCASR